MKINSKAIVATFFSVALIGGVLVYNKVQTQGYIEQQKQMATKGKPGTRQGPGKNETQSNLATVAVMSVIPQNYSVTVSGYGEVTAHYSLTMTSDITGKITHISPYLESGQLVKKGDVLAIIEDSAYQEALASAKADLAEAETDLLEERRQGAQAKKEWERSGLKGKPNALVLREPQLKEAIAEVNYQKAAVKNAQYELEQTKIRAPFNGVIKSRNIELGSVIQSSTEIAEIESSDYVEARILLSQNKWQGLPNYSNAKLMHSPNTWSVILSNESGSWNGYVSCTENHIETDSRQRALIVQVKQPYSYESPLYTGSFVSANIVGKTLTNVWKLPVSALFQGEYIWYVDAESKLQKHSVNILFSQNNELYIAPFSQDELQVVVKPLNYFRQNNKVQVGSDEAKHNES